MCKITLMPSAHHSVWIAMEYIAMTVVGSIDEYIVEKQTVAIIGGNRNLLLLNLQTY
jgi:hypothetical protein